jgi:hypothetical protein
MHWTGWRTDDGAYYRVLIEGLEHDTEVDLAQDEQDNWKLGYVQTPDEDWTVIDLGHFDDEGELLMAADDRLAELLEWPELAEETTLLRR